LVEYDRSARWFVIQSLKVQLTEAAAELKIVKEASVTSEFVTGNTVGPEYAFHFYVRIYQTFASRHRWTIGSC